MGFVLLVDNNVFKNDFKDYIYNNLFMFILCKNKVHLLLDYVIYVIISILIALITLSIRKEGKGYRL
ncbi:hypothetical protein CLOSPI_02220 [Thomasclavelia spiroformis DSM 1552]|uniref:Uncharacterized protein n=1 Tax=Thomasclavelia spiroformis DSM 1552 TaxID=428126 RepID=B1C551_9FIRM|nr:hypothetical protein CLOSPI_02220 [Thomasclavelia spiroformis DSM 1552]